MKTLLTSPMRIVTLFLLLTWATDVSAATLDDAIGDIVVKLSQYLDSKSETSISIGQFVGPPQLAATSGPGIAQLFKQQFERQGVDVKRRARIGIRGQYSIANGPPGLAGVQLSCSLVDPAGQVLTDFAIEAEVVDQPEDVVEILGTTTSLFVEDTDADRSNDLKQSIFNPSLHIEGSKAFSKASSPYALEVAVGGRGLSILDDEGFGFVEIDDGSSYTVRLYNRSDLEAAVRLSIDGLNVFTFSEVRNEKTGEPKYSSYIIPPRSHIELQGWHKTNEIVHSFLITSYAESAAASISQEQNIGTITATFSAAWPKGTPPPDDEGLVGRGDKATGFGPPIKQVSREVERNIGRLRAAINLRYEK